MARPVACAAACTLALALVAAPSAAARHYRGAPRPQSARHGRAAHPAPLPRPVVHRLAHRAQRIHRRHPARAPYVVFLRLARAYRKAHARPRPDEVIRSIWVVARRYGLDPGGMVRVASCESGLSRTATNGQYLGLFQLGESARERYLRGSWEDAYANADAAARYVRDAGGFGPWSCGFAYS